MAEAVNINPSVDPEFVNRLALDVSPEAVAQFQQTFGNMVNEHGKVVTIIGVDGSFRGEAFNRSDSDGNSFGVSRRTDTGALTAHMTTKTEEGQTTDIFRLDQGVLSYENPAKLFAQPGTYEIADRADFPAASRQMRADLIAPTKEVQETMVSDFMTKAAEFEKVQGRPHNRARSVGRHILGKS